MNCRRVQQLIFAQRDRDLSPEDADALVRHVDGCRDCRQVQLRLAQAVSAWRESTAAAPVPDAQMMAATVLHRVRREGASQRATGRKRPRLAWLALPAAVVTALLLVLRPAPDLPEQLAAEEEPVPQAEFVEAGDADAATMVYRDEESGWLIVWAAPPLPDNSI